MQISLKIADPVMQTPLSIEDPIVHSFLHLHNREEIMSNLIMQTPLKCNPIMRIFKCKPCDVNF